MQSFLQTKTHPSWACPWMSSSLSLLMTAVPPENLIRFTSLHMLSCPWHLSLNYHQHHPGYLNGLLIGLVFTVASSRTFINFQGLFKGDLVNLQIRTHCSFNWASSWLPRALGIEFEFFLVTHLVYLLHLIPSHMLASSPLAYYLNSPNTHLPWGFCPCILLSLLSLGRFILTSQF